MILSFDDAELVANAMMLALDRTDAVLSVKRPRRRRL
jgi:hypothetical protein